MSCIVIGAGIAGVSVALELSRRGQKVLLLEQFGPANSRGSSHGPTRIFRLSYSDPQMVALALEALQDWRRLERDARESLLVTTGGLDLGSEAHGCAEALQANGVDADWIEEGECLGRFGLRVAPGTPALFQAEAAVIAASRAVAVQIELAEKAGTKVFFNTAVEDIDPGSDIVKVRTHDGRTFEAESLVVAAGPWTARLLAPKGAEEQAPKGAEELAGPPGADGVTSSLPLVVTHEQVSYFAGVGPEVPIVIDWSDPPSYLVPQHWGAKGARVGVHGAGAVVDPDDGPFVPDAHREGVASEWVARLTEGETTLVGSESCLYTNAPDEQFLLARAGRVTTVSACSGHGFKFGPRMGRAVADICLGINPQLPIGGAGGSAGAG